MRHSRRNPAVLASVLIAGGALAILGMVLLWSPDGRDLPPAAEAAAEPTATPTPTASSTPQPEPELEPAPVAVELGAVRVEDLSTTGTGLYGAGAAGDVAVPVDQPAVEAFRDAIVAALDAHLTDQQRGGPGTLDAGGLDGSDAALQLVGTDQRVTAAAVEVRIGARGGPEWGQVTLDLQHADGGAAVAELVFAPGEPPVLLAART